MMLDLAFRDVSAGYGGAPVLGPVTLHVARGERIALVGKSGAGKSTLLGLMYQHWRDHAALMPQDLGLVETLSVFHNVFMGRLADYPAWYNLLTLIRPMRRDVAAIEAIVARLSMAEKLWSPVGELSGGQRQRTAVARMLYQQSAVLLADEPVSALDGPQAEMVLDSLTTACETLVVAMHDVDLALRYCGRVVGIRDGAIALDETSTRLNAKDLLPLY